MKISEIRDPSLFQRLVRRLYVAERGYEFQVVDDSGGDAGNDGYDAERRLLFSIYCPEKPDSARYLDKGRSDLAKAVALASRPEYTVEGWVFVTPTPLREPTQAALRAEAKTHGLTARFLSAEHLEDLYRRYPHIHDEFPELEYPRVDALLEKIATVILQSPSHAYASDVSDSELGSDEGIGANSYSSELFAGFVAPRLAELQLRLEAGDGAAVAELERYRLEATDVRDRLAAILLEVQYYSDPLDLPKMAQRSASGYMLARHAKARAEAAVFAANLAYAKTLELVARDMDIVGRVAFTNVSGAPLITEDELAKANTDLESLDTEVDRLLSEAWADARASRNLAAMYIVSLRLASCATQRHFPVRTAVELGAAGANSANLLVLRRQQMQSAYEMAIPIAQALGSTGRLGTAYSNFANDLVAFCEYETAEGHAQHALKLAEAAGDQHQVAKTRLLIAKIERERVAGPGSL